MEINEPSQVSKENLSHILVAALWTTTTCATPPSLHYIYAERRVRLGLRTDSWHNRVTEGKVFAATVQEFHLCRKCLDLTMNFWFK